MNARALAILLASVWLGASANAQRGAEPKLYRWVDDDGVVHYGDHVPPEYAARDRDILNEQGVAVGFEEGEVTEQERAEQARRAAIEEAQRRTRMEAARRDRVLLETYLSVAEIEDLRDRRLELLESQIKVTEQYLSNLRKRLISLQQEARIYKPFSDKADAPELPEDLELDISRTIASISLYEQTLVRTRGEQEALKVAFAKDVVRFKELKGI